MPPIRAASARLIPSSTAASDSRRRLWLACLEAAASRRSSSVRPHRHRCRHGTNPPAPWNQLNIETEIASESERKAVGIRSSLGSSGPRVATGTAVAVVSTLTVSAVTQPPSRSAARSGASRTAQVSDLMSSPPIGGASEACMREADHDRQQQHEKENRKDEKD